MCVSWEVRLSVPFPLSHLLTYGRLLTVNKFIDQNTVLSGQCLFTDVPIGQNRSLTLNVCNDATRLQFERPETSPTLSHQDKGFPGILDAVSCVRLRPWFRDLSPTILVLGSDRRVRKLKRDPYTDHDLCN